MPRTPDLQAQVAVEVDLEPVLAPLRVGVADPCWRVERGTWSWATSTPAGPVTVLLAPNRHDVEVMAWGPGVEWLEPHLPRLLGVTDPGVAHGAASPLVTALAERFPRFRVAGHARVADAAVQGVCRRGVSAFEASRSWAFMVEALGDPAPGPGGLRLPPAPRRLASCDPYELHVWGLEQGRADEVRRIASHAGRLELDPDDGGAQAITHLAGITGVGADAVAHARSVALADADALPVLDDHQAAVVLRTLWSEADRAHDDGEVDLGALLEPYAPDRGRLVRLLALAEAARGQMGSDPK